MMTAHPVWPHSQYHRIGRGLSARLRGAPVEARSRHRYQARRSNRIREGTRKGPVYAF